MPKLPKYVFQRANGSYRYKRNVPVSLRQVIPKATVYRQLGTTYDEAIRRLPKVHSEIEALFDLERQNHAKSARAEPCSGADRSPGGRAIPSGCRGPRVGRHRRLSRTGNGVERQRS